MGRGAVVVEAAAEGASPDLARGQDRGTTPERETTVAAGLARAAAVVVITTTLAAARMRRVTTRAAVAVEDPSRINSSNSSNREATRETRSPSDTRSILCF